jgi:hypothetical protein
MKVQVTAKNVAPETLRRSGKGFGLKRASVSPCHSKSQYLRHLPTEELRGELVLTFDGLGGERVQHSSLGQW